MGSWCKARRDQQGSDFPALITGWPLLVSGNERSGAGLCVARPPQVGPLCELMCPGVLRRSPYSRITRLSC